MQYLHTMVRISNVQESLDFYCGKLGMVEVRRTESEAGRYTNIFLSASDDVESAKAGWAPTLELTFNWDGDDKLPSDSRHFGHLAYEVKNIYQTCLHLQENGIVINRPPHDGRMAFVRSPDNISIELLQCGEALEPSEPWTSMPNIGHW